MPEADGSDEQRFLERLALAEWSESATAELVSVTVLGNRAEVGLQVNGGYEYWMYFRRAGGGWREAVTGSGRCIDWDDPTSSQWGDDSESSDSESL